MLIENAEDIGSKTKCTFSIGMALGITITSDNKEVFLRNHAGLILVMKMWEEKSSEDVFAPSGLWMENALQQRAICFFFKDRPFATT